MKADIYPLTQLLLYMHVCMCGAFVAFCLLISSHVALLPLEECGHPVCFVCLSRLHSTNVITASEITTLCVMESVAADVKDCGTSAVTPFM